MNYLTYTQKLEDLKNFIKKGWIKTPKDIAKKLKVSERTALILISHLKEKGHEVNTAQKKNLIRYFDQKVTATLWQCTAEVQMLAGHGHIVLTKHYIKSTALY